MAYNKFVEGEVTSVVICNGDAGAVHNCTIDTEDLDKMVNAPRTWRSNDRRGGYIYYQLMASQSARGKQEITYLHRMLMDCPEGSYVDHINGDVKDNRKSNLRIATQKQNSENLTKSRSNNSSGYRGVSFHKQYCKWEAYFWDNYHKNLVGFFDSAEEANEAVVKARAENMPFSPDFRDAQELLVSQTIH